MDPVQESKMFTVDGGAYESFMGRYSNPLAEEFCDWVGVESGTTALDVGCGPGALTQALVARLGPRSVVACDPSPSFRTYCAERHPGVEVLLGSAEALPFPTASVDHALAQLVLHFVSDPPRAAREMRRVVRPGGIVAACVWDFADGMEMLRAFWDAALALDEGAPDEARTLRFGAPGEIAALFVTAELEDVREASLRVQSEYASFDELWSGFVAGIGPAGAYCAALSEADRARLRSLMFERLGSPRGSFTLSALARCAAGHVR